MFCLDEEACSHRLHVEKGKFLWLLERCCNKHPGFRVRSGRVMEAHTSHDAALKKGLQLNCSENIVTSSLKYMSFQIHVSIVAKCSSFATCLQRTWFEHLSSTLQSASIMTLHKEGHNGGVLMA